MTFAPYKQAAFAPLIQAWLPLTSAVNSLTRSMGEQDFYPFVLTPAVLEKLNLIHTIVRNAL
jgi:hypothetical protein